ncbi:MAG: PHB depolymerase family esterase [Anaerolineales bacterium]
MNRRIFFRIGLLLAAVIAAAAVLVLLLLAMYAQAVYTTPAGEISGRIVSGGEERHYVLHVPKSYDPSSPAPLVISIHGYAEWPAHQMEISRWNEMADRHGFLVAYPAGTGFPLRWRTRGEKGDPDLPMIEVQYFSDLIDTLMAEYAIDPARVYANGLSNGGGMADLLACRLSDRIAAIGGVSGAYLYPRDQCHPQRPVPVIAFHGTADPIVPYAGGESASFHYPFPPVEDWAADWARRNGCEDPAKALPTAGEVTGIRYGNCRGNAEVILYTVHGGGHAWPGGRPLPEWIAGQTTQDIDATAVMWEFFSFHPLNAK